jgi:hypothetical protein
MKIMKQFICKNEISFIMKIMKHNLFVKIKFHLAKVILHLFKCFTKYYPYDDPLGLKNVATIKKTKIESC